MRTTYDHSQPAALPEPVCNLPAYCRDAILHYTAHAVADALSEAKEAEVAQPALGSMSSAHTSPGGPGQPIPMRASASMQEDVARDASRYREFFSAGLPVTFLGVEYRDKPSLDAAIDAARAQQGGGAA